MLSSCFLNKQCRINYSTRKLIELFFYFYFYVVDDYAAAMDSLNGDYQAASEYFKEAIRFLTEHCWIFDSPNTHLLARQVLQRVPTDWVPHLRLGHIDCIGEAIKGQVQVRNHHG